MTKVLHTLILAAAVFAALSLSGCGKQAEPQANKNQPVPPASSTKSNTGPTGTITAKPNPIQVCDKSGAGSTTLTWSSTGTSAVEVHVGKPDGDLFAKTGPSGSWATGKWVGNGMVFYLQDVSDGKPLTRENTIATVVVSVTSEGCPH
jgi:hypothetical protein